MLVECYELVIDNARNERHKIDGVILEHAVPTASFSSSAVCVVTFSRYVLFHDSCQRLIITRCQRATRYGVRGLFPSV